MLNTPIANVQVGMELACRYFYSVVTKTLCIKITIGSFLTET